MKKKIIFLFLLIILSVTLVACDEQGDIVEIQYDKQYEAVTIDEFNLSDIIIFSQSGINFVTEDMLSAEDNAKLKTAGNHLISINYNGKTYECYVTLVNSIDYEIIYNGEQPVLIEDFSLDKLQIKINIDGNVQKIKVTEDMLSSEDLAKFSTAGLHNISVNYNKKVINYDIFITDGKIVYTYTLNNPYNSPVKISEFKLSNIKIVVNDGTNNENVSVTEDMLSSEDLAKLQTVGTHTLTIKFVDFETKVVLTLEDDNIIKDDPIYEILNPYANTNVNINSFVLSNIRIQEITSGETVNVNTSMLSVEDNNKLSQVGTHTITIVYKNFSESITIVLVEGGSGENNDTDIDDIANGYYKSTAGLTGTQLKYALRTIINDVKKNTSYSDLTRDLAKTDPGKTSGKILLFYLRKEVNATWDSGKTWNREHIWPQSQSWFSTSGAGSDIHHIRPTDPDENSRRGNTRYGENGSGYEPKDNVKGDVARIIFYLLTRYSQTDSSYPVTKVATSMNMLLDWHKLDPVDSIETYRNQKAYEIQGNRNPFIDNPDFAYMIWDTTRLTTNHIEDMEIKLEVKIIAYLEDKKSKIYA